VPQGTHPAVKYVLTLLLTALGFPWKPHKAESSEEQILLLGMLVGLTGRPTIGIEKSRADDICNGVEASLTSGVFSASD
jgi:hypothetical protein